MVKILGGEIVPDDDPRLSQSSGQDQPRGDVDTGRTSQASSSTFDWSAPPVRVQYEEGGTGMAGLPGLVVFGAPVSPNHCLMLAAAAVFFGLRGVCVGAILCKSLSELNMKGTCGLGIGERTRWGPSSTAPPNTSSSNALGQPLSSSLLLLHHSKITLQGGEYTPLLGRVPMVQAEVQQGKEVKGWANGREEAKLTN